MSNHNQAPACCPPCGLWMSGWRAAQAPPALGTYRLPIPCRPLICSKAQYKFKRQFFFVSQPSIDVPKMQDDGSGNFTPVVGADGKQPTVRLNITMAHSLFCSCHGKGPSDGETGWLKTKARDLEAEDTRVPDSGSFHSTLKACMEKILDRSKNKRGKHSIYRRVFYFVKRGAVLRRRKSELPDGMDGHVTKNHCFMSMGQNGEVRSRLMPCPCKKCWDAPHFYSPDCTEQEYSTTSRRTSTRWRLRCRRIRSISHFSAFLKYGTYGLPAPI